MVKHRADQSAAVRALKGAAPYIRLFKNRIFVVKAGGAVFGDVADTRALIEQIAILHHLGIKVVLVHGGGPQLDGRVVVARGAEPRICLARLRGCGPRSSL